MTTDSKATITLNDLLDQIAAAQRIKSAKALLSCLESTGGIPGDIYSLGWHLMPPDEPNMRLQVPEGGTEDILELLILDDDAEHAMGVVLDITTRCGPDHEVTPKDIERYLCQGMIPGGES